MPVEYFFPKTFYYKDNLISEDENEKLSLAALRLRDEIKISLRPNLYTTYGIIVNVLERKEFEQLKGQILEEIDQFLQILETRADYKYSISDSWISISGPGNYERMHTHDGAYVSGVYYIKTHPGCGDLIFEEMSDNLWASFRSLPENFNSISYTPVNQRIVLFNSKVPHCVGQNMSSNERIALSFNVILS